MWRDGWVTQRQSLARTALLYVLCCISDPPTHDVWWKVVSFDLSRLLNSSYFSRPAEFWHPPSADVPCESPPVVRMRWVLHIHNAQFLCQQHHNYHKAIYAPTPLSCNCGLLTRFEMQLMIQMLSSYEWGVFNRGSCPRLFVGEAFSFQAEHHIDSHSHPPLNDACDMAPRLLWKNDASRTWWCHECLFSSHTSLMYQI